MSLSMTTEARVLFERRGPVAWVTINRLEAHNAMTFQMWDRLASICEEVGADPDLRVLVITGAGEKAFVSGTDISEFRTFTDPQQALDYEARIDDVYTRIETLAKPVIAAIRGYAVGGGAGMAICCDMRYCTPESRFGIPIARTLGNCLSTNVYARLIDLIGPARTKDMIFTARLFSADQALELGLVNEIVDGNQLEERVMEVANQIAGHAPITIEVTKAAVRYISQHRRPKRNEELILRAYMSEDFQEGVQAFLAKRKPEWKGR